MLQIGKFNQLTITRITPVGAYLSTTEGEVLLPAYLMPRGSEAGSTLEVFIYLDTEEQLTATTKKPLRCCDGRSW